MGITNQHAENVINNYIDRYIQGNRAAATITSELEHIGIGLRPVLDHISIRTLDVLERALEFEALGFRFDDHIGVMERDAWWAKVYRRPGFPAVYINQAFTDERGKESPIPDWVRRFSDGQLHHIAIQVSKIEDALGPFTDMGLEFIGEIAGYEEGSFRQIYTVPEMLEGNEYTVLEVIERRWGFSGFISPIAEADKE